jgi:tRNA threonylcarbamoyl adenosine modification protein (Sua5/YciO/YrdC/YwlC family)
MFLQINPSNIDQRLIKTVVDVLKNDGVIIFPTDTVYALGCDIYSNKAIEKISRLKKVKPEKANFSFICSDLSHISDFTKPFDRSLYKILNRSLPGPFTFILNANSAVPAIFKNNKKTIGIRIPANQVPISIIKELGNPIMSASLHNEDELVDYLTDPAEIFENFETIVDLIIDGGYGGNKPSTIVDCTDGEPVILRQGAGILD